MYRNLDECLYDVYRFGALRIEPQGNTGAVCDWVENKGVTRGRSSLTQAEWHANAAMIQNRIGRVLNRFERAWVQAHYGADFSGLPDMAAAAYARCTESDISLIGDLLVYALSGSLKRTAIMDKYDLSRRTFFRRLADLNHILAEWETSARLKLDDDFRAACIIG